MVIVKTIQSLDVYIFSVFILVLIAIKSLNTPKVKSLQSRVFSVLLIFNFMIIIADCVSVLLDGHPGTAIRAILMTAVVFGYGLQVVICLFWFWYAREVVLGNRKQSRKTIVAQSFPALVCFTMAILSCKTGWFFRYDAGNVYRRGILFPLVLSVSFLYLFLGYFMILRYRQKIEHRIFIALLSFAIPPSIGGIIQTFFYGTTLLWPCMTISLLIIYLAIQNEALLLDYLTGINNRRSFDFTLQKKIVNAKDSTLFALMLVDIDNFQAINDRYGHTEGDVALIAAASILEKFFNRDGFVARYGGDEFAIIIDIRKVDDLSEIKIQLQNELENWNNNCKKPWKISISLGCAPYIPSEKLSPDHFIFQVTNRLRLDKIVPGERRFGNGRRR